jgi:hypothetical protein
LSWPITEHYVRDHMARSIFRSPLSVVRACCPTLSSMVSSCNSIIILLMDILDVASIPVRACLAGQAPIPRYSALVKE